MYRGGSYWSRSSQAIRNCNLRCKHAKSNFLNGELPLKTQQCYNSTSSGSGGTGIYLGASIATVGALIGGAVTYAGYDNGFRKGVEGAVPLSKNVFDMIHGKMVEKVLQSPVEKDLSIPFEPLVDSKPDAGQTPLFADQLESPKKDQKVPIVNTLDTPGVSMIDLDISTISSTEKKVISENDFISETPFDKLSDAGVEELSDVESFVVVKKVDVADLAEENESTSTGDIITEIDDKPLTAEEIETLSTLVDQAAMEILVNTSASNIMMLVQESNALQKQAAEALREYLRSFASALRVPQEASDYAERTKLVSAMESKAQEKFDIAKQKELSIKEEMESLRNLVNAVRESGESEVADAAEKSLNTCTEEMKNVLSEIDVVQRDFDFLLDYQKFIGHAPESLRGHLNSFAVDLVKLLEENKVDLTGLSQDQAIMALALKRTEVLERALEANPDSKYLEDRLKKQQLELKNLAEENLCMELKCLENKMSLEHKMQLQHVEEKYEKEILSQLKRQTSAHNEHLAEELTNQTARLTSKHQSELDSKLTEQQKNYQVELEKNVACINGIKSRITDVVDVERRQKHAQEIWTAAQALTASLTISTMNGRTRTLMPEMISVLQLGERNEILIEMVNCIPEEAALFGVIPKKDLLNRFKSVKHECKKVAMVGEGDSLGMYLLSYVKSLFVFSSWYISSAESPINPDEVTSYEILEKAEYFITQQGDLETAAKLMSQLKGVPRKLCGDWLNEVRMFLETKQTALLLQAYAASLTVGFE